jgi:long-subunit fatty acid transport protein
MKKCFDTTHTVAWLVGILVTGISVSAQDAESLDQGMAAPATHPTQSEKQSGLLPVVVNAGFNEQFNGSIDKGGNFSISRFMSSVGVPVRLNDRMELGTVFRYSYDHFNFDNTTAPWVNINTIMLASVLQRQVNDNVTIYGGPYINMSAESGSSLGDGLTGGGMVGVSYKFDADLSVGLGLAAGSRLEENAWVLPLFTARWKFADNWRLDAGLTDLSRIGYGIELKYLMDEEFDFGYGLQFHRSRFKINGSKALGPENGDGQESSSIL